MDLSSSLTKGSRHVYRNNQRCAAHCFLCLGGGEPRGSAFAWPDARGPIVPRGFCQQNADQQNLARLAQANGHTQVLLKTRRKLTCSPAASKTPKAGCRRFCSWALIPITSKPYSTATATPSISPVHRYLSNVIREKRSSQPIISISDFMPTARDFSSPLSAYLKVSGSGLKNSNNPGPGV